jgi:hypothetical protein
VWVAALTQVTASMAVSLKVWILTKALHARMHARKLLLAVLKDTSNLMDMKVTAPFATAFMIRTVPYYHPCLVVGQLLQMLMDLARSLMHQVTAMDSLTHCQLATATR